MKFTVDDPTHIHSIRGQVRTITKNVSRFCRWVMLTILVIALAACTPRQQGSSGGSGGEGTGVQVTSTPATSTSSGNAGGAILKLERNKTLMLNGDDTQREFGTVPLVFSNTVEGDLTVEGTGKIEWTEVANYSSCGFKAKADGKVSITGLFTLKDCKFHLTIATQYSQPTTYDQAADCTYSITFSQTEFSSQIELDPSSGRSKETTTNGWWEISTVTLSDLKSDQVTSCFPAEVITGSTPTP